MLLIAIVGYRVPKVTKCTKADQNLVKTITAIKNIVYKGARKVSERKKKVLCTLA